MTLSAALLCLALNIHFESRGEPYEGQIAVADVTINRSQKNNTSICHEVYKKGQFSWTKNKHFIPKGIEWEHSKKVASMVLRTRLSLHYSKRTGGAIYFFNPKKCKAHSIISGRKKVKKIGNHVFYTSQ